MTTNKKEKTTGKPKIDRWIWTVPALIILTVISHLIIYSRPGGMTGVLLYYLGALVICFFAFVFLVIGLIVSRKKKPYFNRWRTLGFISLLSFLVLYVVRADHSGNYFDAYPSSHDKEISPVHFRLPFDSLIAVGWGGGESSVNYHVSAPDQCWAYDLLRFNNGKTYSGDSLILDNYFCYGIPVLAPANGLVVATNDTAPDTPIGSMGDLTNLLGNYIIIQVAPHQYLFLCHLKPKSIKVVKGDTIIQRQPLALVGNSGHSSEPHLHMHLQDTPTISFGEGIPLYFYNYYADGKFVKRGIPTGGIDAKGTFIGQTVWDIQ